MYVVLYGQTGIKNFKYKNDAIKFAGEMGSRGYKNTRVIKSRKLEDVSHKRILGKQY